ncbi:hypothetical protein [Rhizobium sp.]|uniref:hypothetical protein n=1 Tax=Rhizobium sp. TaxID=391 RepID=UPI0028A611A5
MANYIRYFNQNATRSQPLDEDLIKRLAYLEDMGITAHVISGGQPGIDEGGARTGSVRHDHGHSMDADFYMGDRKLDWNNPDDLPIFQKIVSQGKAAGITGIGGADDYMGAGRLHMGMGTPSRWGAGGKSDNAPAWLAAAYDGTKYDPVADVIAAGPAKPTSSPTSDNPLFAMIQGKSTETPKPEEPKSQNGVLVDAYNRLTGSNVQVPKTIPDNVPIFGGAETAKVMKGIGGLGDLGKAMSAETESLNRQASQAAARAQAGRNSQPVELTFIDYAAERRKKKGALGGLGGYFV